MSGNQPRRERGQVIDLFARRGERIERSRAQAYQALARRYERLRERSRDPGDEGPGPG